MLRPSRYFHISYNTILVSPKRIMSFKNHKESGETYAFVIKTCKYIFHHLTYWHLVKTFLLPFFLQRM